MNGPVDDETGEIDRLVGLPVDDISVQIDLDQVGCRDLLVRKPEGIDEEVLFITGNPHRDVIVDQVVHAEHGGEAVRGREILPQLCLRHIVRIEQQPLHRP